MSLGPSLHTLTSRGRAGAITETAVMRAVKGETLSAATFARLPSISSASQYPQWFAVICNVAFMNRNDQI